MSHATPFESEVTSALSHLKLSTAPKPKKKPVADSWDDNVSSSDEAETEGTQTASTASTTDTTPPITAVPSYETPHPPPPTPASLATHPAMSRENQAPIKRRKTIYM